MTIQAVAMPFGWTNKHRAWQDDALHATMLQLGTLNHIMTTHRHLAARLFALSAWIRLLLVLPALALIWLLTGWALA